MNKLFWVGLECERKKHGKAHQALQMIYQWIGRSEGEYIRDLYIRALKIIAEQKQQEDPDDDGPDFAWVHREIELQNNAPMDSLLWLPDDAVRFFRPLRVERIREAIRKGIVIPAHVMREYPDNYFEEDFRSLPPRMRAYHTAVSGRLGEIDITLLTTHGTRLRRQDGNPITRDQRLSIKEGLDELSIAMGNQAKLYRATNLMISHSNGRRLFEAPNTHAIHRPHHQTINLCVNSNSNRTGLDCLAHELIGHWLDHSAVPPQRWVNRIMPRSTPYAREVLCVSFLDAIYGKEATIYARLLESMTPYSSNYLHSLPDLFSPSEVWSRAVEQYVADRLFLRGIRAPKSTKPLEYYYHQPGYWEKAQWCSVMRKSVQEGVRARLWMGERMHGLSQSRVQKPSPTYRKVFPWVDQLDLKFVGHYMAELYLPRNYEE